MPDGFRLIRKIKANLPGLKLPEATFGQVGKVASAAIVDNIRKQRQADGSRIRTNAPSTREKKRREGKRQLSLVDEKHRFVQGRQQSFKPEIRGSGKRKSLFIVPATPELRKLSRLVQAKDYTGWFALGREHRAAIKVILRTWLRKEFQKASKRR